MSKSILIDGSTIGPGQRCFVIAEAGVNHNGSLALARELVLKAKAAGADCVKFQTFDPGTLAAPDAPKAEYQRQTTNTAETQFEMLRHLQLDRDGQASIAALCREQKIIFLSTPYSADDADFLDSIGVGAFKLASMHCAEPDFIEYVARKGKPIILSTGMSTLGEIDAAVHACRVVAGNDRLILLQCTTDYPSRVEDANLRAMVAMRDRFDVSVGYSDHTQTMTASTVAVALGACVIEKHLTLDRSMIGPDHAASFDPGQFSELVAAIRQAEAALGSSIKQPCDAEIANARVMRRSLAALRRLSPGDRLTEDAVTLLRPGVGLPPGALPKLLGRRLIRDVSAGTLLSFQDFEALDPAPNVEIRSLAQSDALAVAELLTRQRRGYSEHFFPFAFDERTIAEILRNAVRDRFWGIASGRELVGISMLRGFDQGYDRPAFGVFVTEEYAGRGLARKALDHAVSWCRSARIAEVMLKVSDQNLAASHLFRKAGFEPQELCARTGHRIHVLKLGESE